MADLSTLLSKFLTDLYSGSIGGSSQWSSLTLTKTALGTTSTDSLTVRNSTAATSGTTVQISPRVKVRGTGWDSDDAVSRTVDFFLEALPATGTTVTGSLKVGYSLDGAAASYPLILTSAGQLQGLDGTAAAPSYSFAGEAGLGWYRSGTNQLSYAAAGAQFAQFNGANFYLLSNSSAMLFGASSDVVISRGAANNLALASGDSWSIGGAQAAATTSTKLIKKVTGIADAVATDVLTVTVPNANHAATILVTLLSSNGSTDAFESSRVATGSVVLARTSGANVVAAVSTLEAAQIATVSGGATHTLAYGVSSISGAVGATNTFTIQVTVNDSGNLGSNQVVVVAELVNAEATGVTVA